MDRIDYLRQFLRPVYVCSEILKPYLQLTQNLLFQIMTITARNNTHVSYDYVSEKGWRDAKFVGRKKETDDH